MRTPLSLILSFSVLLGGCFDFGGDDFGDEAGCIGAEIQLSLGGIFQARRGGAEGRAELRGLCSTLESCSASSPLMRGAEPTIIVEGVRDSGDRPQVSKMESSDPSVLLLGDQSRACGFAQATLDGTDTGTATVSVFAASGAELDHFDFEVADPMTLSIEQKAGLPVGAEGLVVLVATGRDADERALVMQGAVTWTVEDDGVLILDDEQSTGGIFTARSGQPGTTTVRASAGGLEATFEVTIP